MSLFDVRYDRPLHEASDLLMEGSYMMIDPVDPGEGLRRVLVLDEGDPRTDGVPHQPAAWGIGANEFDAAMRAVLALNPDHIIDYPDYMRDYEDEENF